MTQGEIVSAITTGLGLLLLLMSLWAPKTVLVVAGLVFLAATLNEKERSR